MDPKRDRHMRSGSLELLGTDEIRSEWAELGEGKPVLVVKSHLVRSVQHSGRRHTSTGKHR